MTTIREAAMAHSRPELVGELLHALRNLADDVKGIALNTYSSDPGDFYEVWEREDPEGYGYWIAAVEAIAKAELE